MSDKMARICRAANILGTGVAYYQVDMLGVTDDEILAYVIGCELLGIRADKPTPEKVARFLEATDAFNMAINAGMERVMAYDSDAGWYLI
jgi:hypothetical protein